MNWIKKLFKKEPETPKTLTISIDLGTLEKYKEGKEIFIKCETGHTIVLGSRDYEVQPNEEKEMIVTLPSGLEKGQTFIIKNKSKKKIIVK